MRCRAEITIPVSDSRIVFDALAPEIEDEFHQGLVDIQAGNGVLMLRLEGQDTISLRAALNTWIRLIRIGFMMVEI